MLFLLLFSKTLFFQPFGKLQRDYVAYDSEKKTVGHVEGKPEQIISNFNKLFTKHILRRCFEVMESKIHLSRVLDEILYLDMPKYEMAGCYKENLDFCVEEALGCGCM